MGAIVGLMLASVGISLMSDAAGNISDTFAQFDMDLSFLESSLTTAALFNTIANLILCVYGCREKLRTRMHTAQHAKGCLAKMTGELFNLIMTVAFIACVVFSVILLMMYECLAVTFFVTNLLCDFSTQAAEGAIDAINDIYYSGVDVDDINVATWCNDFEDLKSAGLEGLIGSLLFLAGEIMVMVYWTKYSTMRHIVDKNTPAGMLKVLKNVAPVEAKLFEAKNFGETPETAQPQEFEMAQAAAT